MAAFPIKKGGRDLTGMVCGRLTVTEWNYKKNGVKHWICNCQCGGCSGVAEKSLVKGVTQSCGCIHREWAAEMGRGQKKHGRTHSPEYRSWRQMQSRCRVDHPDPVKRASYADRGIVVCDRWKGEEGFTNFLSDMGLKPSADHTVDRINNDGPYSPENCRWANRKEQQRNTRRNVRYTAFGESKTVPEWAEEYGICKATLRSRLKNGWDIEQALTTPVIPHKDRFHSKKRREGK